MKPRNVQVSTSLLIVLVMATVVWLNAGNLNPPAGPVTGTMKSLSEVEPRTAINAFNTPGDADSLFKITAAGSYYLSGNITGVAAKHGIEIAASGVTLDLNGFDLVGVGGTLDGVSATVLNVFNIAVVNGSVHNWGGEGVDLSTLNANNCRVTDVLASNNVGNGIFTGNGCTVSNCSAFSNSGNGISAGVGSTVSDCSAYQNNGIGIHTSVGCTVSNCSAYLNTSIGIFASGDGCTVSNCSAYNNTGNGIHVGIGCTVSNGSASNNADGISVSTGCTVVNCAARSNTVNGIVCSLSCVIRGNTCSANGNGGDGAGIHATSSDNRIEGNNCVNADRGIDVDDPGNIIIKNTCSGNTTDWDLAANNVFGPIIDRRVPGSAAVSGFSAASSLGSTDGNANFTY